ncbi:hypothetical protein VFPFJ_00357 [Purpureocillium lilacinum]|uniref:Uncharacterized protein n=1 Tax=Purpureocillium lilacinum TaxID=33203 RepID=A0A179HA34_PURLI|nr:hypothetical protein VFPFJ_00357 [Purpureocillium lilacinum]OAQ86289.1 hypothetical protein VFPBJ_00329 [Purpureocillium lilacinum]OAQ94248.1 hypothetical protein VFPFJ_00357 [Purpureocillium lilacinum]
MALGGVASSLVFMVRLLAGLLLGSRLHTSRRQRPGNLFTGSCRRVTETCIGAAQ